jgi:hypothetical protein
MSDEKFKQANEAGNKIFTATIPSIEFGKEGEKMGHLYALGQDVVVTTRELSICPAVAFASTTMGQKGVELAFYRGGIYTGRFWAINTVEAGYAKWDESLINFHVQSISGFGHGVAYLESYSLEQDKPGLVMHVKNTTTYLTTIKILKEIQKDDPNLKVDFNRPFDQYIAGFATGYFRLLMEKRGCPAETVKKIQGWEVQCQAQGKEHCIIAVGILD